MQTEQAVLASARVTVPTAVASVSSSATWLLSTRAFGAAASTDAAGYGREQGTTRPYSVRGV